MGKAITVEGLSKAYQLGDFGTGTISRDVERFIARIRGKEDPYLRIGETNDRTVKGDSDIVWCLKDLNFDIEQGDAVGIIGRNGAGKSTLLKILSRITAPTTGSIKVKGRVASLLEVGTGFHPELTGRENVYLNGAILGMRKAEIKRRFDEIVDFSGVERYIDTPVKRYSSGMYVRLAFAVAAHLESEILIVDEVLAVGDAEFQKKCLGKLGDVSTGEGRTVLFVSHNTGSIKELCDKGMVLENGNMALYSNTYEAIKFYEARKIPLSEGYWENRSDHSDTVRLKTITIKDQSGNTRAVFANSEKVILIFELECIEDSNNVKIGFDLMANSSPVFRSEQVDIHLSDTFLKGKSYSFSCEIPSNLLNLGDYSIRPLLSIHCVRSLIDFYEPIIKFSVFIDSPKSIFHLNFTDHNHPGPIFPILPWKCE